MKAKKVTKVQLVKNLLAIEPTITAKGVASALAIGESYAGTLLWKAKGGKQSSGKVTAKKTLPLRSPDSAYAKLKAENAELHGWCLEWRKKCEALQEEIFTFKNQYADTRAVINYLEAKIAQLVGK